MKMARDAGHFQVGRVGFEPTRALARRILSPLRLPFRHRPAALVREWSLL